MDEELEEELQFHLEMQTRKNLARGLSADEARRETRLQFGGVEPAKEECRDARGINFVETFWRDFRYAVRSFGRTPGFTAVALLALMLGIGANTAIFSVVYAVLLAPLPYPNPDQLVMVWSKINGHRARVSAGDYLDWKRQSTAFQSLGAWGGANFNLSISGRPEVIRARVTTPGLIDLQGIRFSMGRDFLPEEGEVGKDHVAIMTHRLWERLGADPNIVGKQIRLNGEPYIVVGVFAPGMADRFESHLIVPLAFKPDQTTHDNHSLLVMGRLKPGVTLQQANADMDIVTRRLTEVYPTSNKGWGASVEILHHDFTSPDTIKGLWLLMGAVGFVLLIACVNVANLLLARGTVRQKEVAVRASLGARRSQLFSQFLTESVALALLGGALGVGLAWAMLKVILATLPPFSIPTEADVHLSVPVLFFSLAATFLAGVLCGCAPAWQFSRWNLSDALKESGRAGYGVGRHPLRRSLIVVEFALALTLLAGAGLALHSFWKLTRVDLGFRTDHILTFSLDIPSGRFSSTEQITAFYRQLLDKLHALPGVSSASTSTGMPLRGTNFGMAFSIAGQPAGNLASRPAAGFTMVTPEYFSALGIQILKGRGFTEQDMAGSEPVAIVNETFARKYLSTLDPLAQRVVVAQVVPGAKKLGPPIEWHVVGIHRDVHNEGIRGKGSPEINVPFWQSPWPDAAIEVRTAGDPASMINSIAAVVQSVDPELGLQQARTMDQLVDESLAGDWFATIFLVAFAGMALLLAAIGIYGMMSFAVAQRTHEIGLRMALGAGRAQVLRLVLKEGLSLAIVGLLVGIGGTYFVGRIMKSILYGISAADPASAGAVIAVLLLSALFACYIPARRATRVDPMVALRAE
jgi:putative ABC transport system permease protein